MRKPVQNSAIELWPNARTQWITLALLALLSTINSQLSTALAQGTAFTYQGRLNDGANPANGLYDLQFAIYNAPTSGNLQGNLITNNATAVSNGLFTATLDFGNQFPGAGRWLEISARTNGTATFVTLAPRQELTPIPYSIQSANAATAGSVAAANITGTLSAAQLSASVVTNGEAGVNFSGTFSGNGSGVTNVDLGTISSGGAITWGNFVLASWLNVNAAARAVTAADVNGDDKVDLICANSEVNTLSVLTNDGRGGFVLASSPGVGSNPLSITAADVNGDGKVDLISANSGNNTLSVLTNDGRGGFVLASSPAVGSEPWSVAAADVNGDGKVDLISANFGDGDNTLSVLTNNGSGGFVLASSPAVGDNPQSVVAADVNGDGKVDLISANYGNNTLSVLTNNGSGGFVLASSPVVGSGPSSVVATDVNGDGKVDLICANFLDNTLSVLTNNGSGGFVMASTYFIAAGSNPNFGSGSQPISLTAADVNGDGKPDLVCANFNGNTLSVLTNNGNGGFILAASLNVGGESSPQSVVAADVNGDGKVDLISADPGYSVLSVFLNTPAFNGNGSGLTSLNASQLTNGTLPNSALAGTYNSTVTFNNAADSFTGSFSGNGSGLTNVALLAGGNSFTGNQTVTNGNVGIATTTPGRLLQIGSSNSPADALINLSCGTGGGAARSWEVGVPYGTNNATGDYYSFTIRDTGAGDRMVIRWDSGNVGIGTNNPQAALHVVGSILATGTVNGTSDRNVKENFAPVDTRAILDKVAALPITTWSYIADKDVRHVGPMAQDFYAAFNVGMDDKHISMVDADGVSLAAIQALDQKVESENQKLESENADLKARLEKLERLINAQKGN